MWLILAVVAAGVVAYLYTSNAQGETMNESIAPTLDEIFQHWGDEYGVDWKLAKAIAMQESSLNPNAVNSADNESLGLMQILCRPDGNGGCQNRLNVDGWSDATREKLLTPDYNIQIGVQILKWNIQQYGLPKAIAVYNKWDERTSPQEGPFGNQVYVDRVLNFYKGL